MYYSYFHNTNPYLAKFNGLINNMNCRVCKQPITRHRFRKYCSTECRNKFYNDKYRVYSYNWQVKRRNKIASQPNPFKCQCLICGRYYIQVGSHIVQVHRLTARQYREYFKLEVKRGITPDWFRKLKGDQALDNGTYKNLEKGKAYWFEHGDHNAGRYERSPITMARLKLLYKYKKKI